MKVYTQCILKTSICSLPSYIIRSFFPLSCTSVALLSTHVYPMILHFPTESGESVSGGLETTSVA